MFLEGGPKFDKKSEVIYLMVQIRKFIDSSGTANRDLKFYANWAIHGKALNFPLNKKYVARIFSGISEEDWGSLPVEKKSRLNNFCLLKDFSLYLCKFMSDNRLPFEFMKRDNWDSFKRTYLEIVEECFVDFPEDDNFFRLILDKDGNGPPYFRLSHRGSRKVLKIKLKNKS